jgi:hypothetical protein
MKLLFRFGRLGKSGGAVRHVVSRDGCGARALKPTRLSVWWDLFFGGAVLLAFCRPCDGAPHEFRESFDGPKTSCSVLHQKSQVRMLAHRRHAFNRFEGRGSESVELEVLRAGAVVQLEHQLPPARVLADLKLSVQIQSNRSGAYVLMRVVFPHQKDPRSGDLLKTYVRGDTYTNAGRWQQLNCTADVSQIRKHLVLLRAQLNEPNLDSREMYVDRVILRAQLQPGAVEFFVDDLRIGGIVSPDTEEAIVQVRNEDRSREKPPAAFRLDRLLVESHPFFPRITAYHDENLDSLKGAGFNVVWVPDFADDELLLRLRERNIWPVATPPLPQSSSGTRLNPRRVGLLPFTEETKPILFWMAGTQIPPEAKDDFVAWNDQIRSADRRYQRPVMADVTGLEHAFSRHVDMLGSSRRVTNTSFSYKQYRDALLEKKRVARPGSYRYTWIFTEPDPATVKRRKAAGQAPIIIEPAQTRSKVYAALAAGCRAIGYWKTLPLDDDVPGAFERRLILTQLNLEIELLEPWLATGSLDNQVPFTIKRRVEDGIGQRRLDFRHSEQKRRQQQALLRAREDHLQRDAQIDRELEAAVIRSDYGTLLLLVWYQHGAQFVPGQMVANNAKVIVPGVEETATAWEVTTTGVRSLKRTPVPGGIEVSLDRFDQTAAIIFPSERRHVAQLRKKIAEVAQKSAQVSIELARAKLVRVRTVVEELQALQVGQVDAPQLLAGAATSLQQAEAAFDRGDLQGYHLAREHSADVLQFLRILQRAHWNDAVRSLGAAVASPHTISFQTLSDHWQMIRRLGRGELNADANLLRSGDFEDMDTMMVDGWQHRQDDVDGVRATAELHPDARQGKYALRLVAIPDTGTDPPKFVPQNPVSVTTAPVRVRHGQIVHVSGWVQVKTPIRGDLDGAMLYDSQTGPIGGLRWHDPAEWRRFAFVREIEESGDLTVTMELRGLGEIKFDDLRILAHTPASAAPPGQPGKLPDAQDARPSRLGILDRLPRLRRRQKSQ